jgi:hypothetical protein
VDSQQYAAGKLAEANSRLVTTHRECERTKGTTTPEGAHAHSLARECRESDRRHIVYWTAEAAMNGPMGRED